MIFFWKKKNQEEKPLSTNKDIPLKSKEDSIAENSNDKKLTFASKLKKSFSNTAKKITDAIGITSKTEITDETIDNIKRALILSDIGSEFSNSIVDDVVYKMKKLKEGNINQLEKIKQILCESILTLFKNTEVVNKNNPINILELDKLIDEAKSQNLPYVVLFVGVNGSGKTTTIGKLASHYKSSGKRVLLAACDTFRAAAEEQLISWSQNVGLSSDDIVIGAEKKSGKKVEPASVAFQAIQKAIDQNYDLVFIDTAGRLHNNVDLMSQIEKLYRVLNTKINSNLPHNVVIVLDGFSGQNVFSQISEFRKYIPINGAIVTKLDGTAKAGFIIPLVCKYNLPVQAVSFGEGKEDIISFDEKDLATAITSGIGGE